MSETLRDFVRATLAAEFCLLGWPGCCMDKGHAGPHCDCCTCESREKPAGNCYHHYGEADTVRNFPEISYNPEVSR